MGRGELAEQRSPGRVRPIGRCRHFEFGAAEHVDHEDVRAGFAAGIAEEHEEEAVRRPGRPLVMETFREYALARPVRLHYANGKRAGALSGEGDVIALRRPDRRRIAPLAVGNPLRIAAARRHDVKLLVTSAIRLEDDLRTV